MSDEGECTICEGGGGWWQGDTDRLLVPIDCTHCDGTGIEPGPGPQRTLDVEEYL